MAKITIGPNGELVRDDGSDPSGPVADARNPAIGIAGFETVDPASIGNGSGNADGNNGSGEPVKRGRGRPAGSGGAKAGSPKKAQGNLKGVEGLLLSLHMMVAGMAKAPEFAINEMQAQEMAKAIDAVTDEHLSALDPKTMAYVNLAIVMSGVYGSAYYRFSSRKEKERKARLSSVSPIQTASNG